MDSGIRFTRSATRRRELNVIATLNIPTVTFSLQYAPLFEAPRIGTVTYRSLLIATGEAKPRTGEQKLDASPILEARATANAASLRAARENVAAIRSAIDRISGAFATHGATADLEFSVAAGGEDFKRLSIRWKPQKLQPLIPRTWERPN